MKYIKVGFCLLLYKFVFVVLNDCFNLSGICSFWLLLKK